MEAWWGLLDQQAETSPPKFRHIPLHIAIPRVDARVIGYSSRQYAMAVFSFPATLRVIRRANSILVYPSTISAFQGLYKWGSEQVCA